MDIVTYALCKKLAAAAVSGVKNITVDGLNLNIETTDGNTMTMTFPKPIDGINGKDGKDGINGIDGQDGISISTIEIPSCPSIPLIPSLPSFPKPIDGINGKDGKDGINGIDGQDGISIVDIEIDENNHLICTLSDNTKVDAGKFPTSSESGEPITFEYATDTDIDKLFEDDTTVYPDPGIQYATDEDIDNLFKEEEIK